MLTGHHLFRRLEVVEAWQMHFRSDVEHGAAGHRRTGAPIVTKEHGAQVVWRAIVHRTTSIEGKARRLPLQQ